MKRATVLAVGFLAVLAIATNAPAKHGGARTLVSFDTMYGVDGPFVNDATTARTGVVGDELPWKISVGKGSLKSNGHLKIKVRGLVFTDDPEVPADKKNLNDEAQFRGLVSCLTEQGTALVPANVETNGFNATPTGNADIDATVTLPNPCVAPIVFVLSGSEEKWFAVAGFESEGTSPTTR